MSDVAARLNARLGLGKVVPSHRSTSNSRGPGQQGTVYVRGQGIATCEACGSLMSNLVPQGRHSVRWADLAGRWVKVNCQGREVLQ